jgi:DNA adenine methylase
MEHKRTSSARAPSRGDLEAVAAGVGNGKAVAAVGHAKPFVKWAGGKRQLLPKILHHVPERYGAYHEPFVGGGAVFFALPFGTEAYLSDSNERLVRTYRGIKGYVEEVIHLLKQYPRNRAFYLDLRHRNIDAGTDAEVAAWFIYLNKMGFNGLYRVNSKNKFNVPVGDNPSRINVCDEDNLRACARALATATIVHQDFEHALRQVKRGDLVYLDPPYVPLSATSYFTSYTVGGFTPQDQHRLRDAALALKKKGARVILSNSSSAAELYREGFSAVEVLAARNVNSKGDRRGKIAELLIT